MSTMTITWHGDTTSIDLHPTWVVDEIKIHTVKNMAQPDGSRRDTIVLYISANAAQLRELIHQFGRESLPLNILGLEVIPLYPNAVLWTWKAPKGYGLKDSTYTALSIAATQTGGEDGKSSTG